MRDQGRSLQAQDHYQLVTTRRSPAPLSLVPKLCQIEVLSMPRSLRKYTRHFSAINLLRQNETSSNPPLGQELEVKMYVGADASGPSIRANSAVTGLSEYMSPHNV